jgi:hypothetical protein
MFAQTACDLGAGRDDLAQKNEALTNLLEVLQAVTANEAREARLAPQGTG